MSNTAFIGFDFETGGTDYLVNPALTAYFCALDKDLNILGELSLKIRPSAPYDKIEQAALDVNKIDLKAHLEDPETLSREEAGKKLQEFLQKFGGKGPRDKNRPKPLGHNVGFDMDFLTQLISGEVINKHFHYSQICTKVVADFLKLCGLLPPEIGTLQSLVKHFNIPQKTAHEAKGDTLMMVGVLYTMIKMIKSLKESSGLSVDILSMLEK